MFYEVIKILEQEIKRGLPGWEAQKKMVPPGRGKWDEEKIKQFNPKISSVLIWLYPKNNEIFTRLILRTQIGKVHAGQIAFPGGKVEKSDADLWQTALREAYEEVGLPQDKIRKVGELSSVYIPPSNFFVHPFIGYSEEELKPVIEETEVVQTIDVNIQTLLDQTIKEDLIVFIDRLNKETHTPSYNIQGHIVWGATAMILSELEALLRIVYDKIGRTN